MTEFNRAVIIGGFGADHRFIEPLANAITTGPDSFVRDVDVFSIGEAFADPDKLAKAVEGAAAVAHSAGNMAVKKAAAIFSLNGVEPTRLDRTIGRAAKIAFNSKREAHVPMSPPWSAPIEVVRHPSTLLIPLRVIHFSTLEMLIDAGSESFPQGRFYLRGEDDQFRFGSPAHVAKAQAHGIVSEMLPGLHNNPMYRPLATAAHMHRLLNA